MFVLCLTLEEEEKQCVPKVRVRFRLFGEVCEHISGLLIGLGEMETDPLDQLGKDDSI